jgi:hypothetical protein
VCSSDLSTAELLRRLHDLEDAPWLDWYGSPLSGRGLAKLLGPYRVVPTLRRVRGTVSRGYFRSEFEDAWSRYAPEAVTSVTSVTPEALAPAPVTDVTDVTVPGEPTHQDPEHEVQQLVTHLDFDAPLCGTCGRRKRSVADGSGRYVCTFPHSMARP